MEFLIKFVESFSLQLLGQLEQGGHFAVFWLTFLDRFLMVLIPSEIVLPAFGVLIADGKLSLLWVIIFSTLGSALGDFGLYIFARLGGRFLLEKYGRYIFIKKHELDHSDRLFEKHGGKIVIISRFIPILKSLVSIPAGVARMPIVKFLLYTIIGSLPVNVLYIYLGIAFGRNLEKISELLSRFSIWALIIVVILVAWYVYRHIRKRHMLH